MFENLAEKFAGKPKSNNLAMTPLIKSLFRRPQGEFGDCIFAAGLDDAVGKSVLHDEVLVMLSVMSVMSCWPFSGHDDRAAQAGDGLHHCQDDDVLRLLGQDS